VILNEKKILGLIFLSLFLVACSKEEYCYDIYEPVCGVDGVTYPNDCYAKNVEIDYSGECLHYEPVLCTIEQKQAEMCTMEYLPVCGDDGLTYGNACAACSSGNIDYYIFGECP
jgi:hypothetical protein